MSSRCAFAIALAITGVLGLAISARASDGVLEINQACVAAGCGPADTPGFPISTEPGKSYVLTSDLQHSASIVQVAAGATLDMNGFSTIGTGTCTGVPASCGTAFNASGVWLGKGASVRNGSVRNSIGDGIRVSGGNRIESMLIEKNGGVGVNGEPDYDGGVTITGNIIRQNGGHGIAWGGGDGDAIVRDNVIYGNGKYGVYAGGILATGNTITRNANFGLGTNFSPGSPYGRNLLIGNAGAGNTAQTDGSAQLGSNVCGTDLTCP